MSEYQTLTSYRNGLLQNMWQSLKAELIAAEHFNSDAELPLNKAQQDRFGEVAAAIIMALAKSEYELLASFHHAPERKELFNWCHSDQYTLKKDLRILSGSQQIITDTYNISNIMGL
jgi:hypothetical protein